MLVNQGKGTSVPEKLEKGGCLSFSYLGGEALNCGVSKPRGRGEGVDTMKRLCYAFF